MTSSCDDAPGLTSSGDCLQVTHGLPASEVRNAYLWGDGYPPCGTRRHGESEALFIWKDDFAKVVGAHDLRSVRSSA